MAKITQNNVSDSDTKTAVETAAPTEGTQTDNKLYDGVTNFVYIGPSLPGGKLKSYTVLNGTFAEIKEFYNEAITLYPSVLKLIVPVSRLAESREKAEKSGNILHKYCEDVSTEIKTKGENE